MATYSLDDIARMTQGPSPAPKQRRAYSIEDVGQMTGVPPYEIPQQGLPAAMGSAFVRGATDVPLSVPQRVATIEQDVADWLRPRYEAIERGRPMPRVDHTDSLSIPSNALKQTRLSAFLQGDAETRQKLLAEVGVPLEQRPMYAGPERARKAIEQAFPVERKHEGRLPTQIASGFGSTLGFAATELAGRAMGLPPMASVALTGSAVNAQNQFREAIQSGASFEEASRASDISGIAGVSEALPIARFFDRFDKGTGGTIRKALKEGFKGGLEEGVQELGQIVIDNLAAKGIYDPERGVFQGGAEGTTVGFTVGGLLSFLAAAAGAKMRPVRTPPEAPGEAPEAAGTTVPPEAPSPAGGPTAAQPEADIVSRLREVVPGVGERDLDLGVPPIPEEAVAGEAPEARVERQAEARVQLDQSQRQIEEVDREIEERQRRLTGPRTPPQITATYTVEDVAEMAAPTQAPAQRALPAPERLPVPAFRLYTQKHMGEVPEITRLPAEILTGRDIDEIRGAQASARNSGLSLEEWAKTVDLSEPVDVTVYADGTLQVQDGHHRLLAAKTLGLPLNVNLKGINAKPDRLNELVAQYGALPAPASPPMPAFRPDVGMRPPPGYQPPVPAPRPALPAPEPVAAEPEPQRMIERYPGGVDPESARLNEIESQASEFSRILHEDIRDGRRVSPQQIAKDLVAIAPDWKIKDPGEIADRLAAEWRNSPLKPLRDAAPNIRRLVEGAMFGEAAPQPTTPARDWRAIMANRWPHQLSEDERGQLVEALGVPSFDEATRELDRRGYVPEAAAVPAAPAPAQAPEPEAVAPRAQPAPRPAPAAKPARDRAIALQLRKQAETLAGQIEAKRNPAIAQQNPTARRARIAAGIAKEADMLADVQTKLIALADQIETGTVEPVLAGVRTRKVVETLRRAREYGHSFPSFWGSNLKELAEKARGKKGTAAAVRWAERFRNDDYRIPFTSDAAKHIETLAKAGGRDVRYHPALDDLSEFKSLAASGITAANWDEAKAAIGRLGQFQETPEQQRERERRELERQLIGARIPGYFSTPEPLASRVIDEADIKPGMKVLEPSAGHGALADIARDRGADVDVIEFNQTLRDILERKGYAPVASDFTEYSPGPVYDRIVMNPPFEDGQDAVHVQRAFDALKPGGRMVAIMGEGTFFRGDRTAAEFRDWLDKVGGESERLPTGSFLKSLQSTGVNARLVTIDKPEAREARREQPAATKPARKIETLTQFLKRRGGIRETAAVRGELRARDITNKRRPGLISNKGMTLDDATLAAWEAGFIPGPERPSPDALLSALERDLRDKSVVRETDQAEADVANEQAAAQETEERVRQEIKGYAREIGEHLKDAEIAEIMADMIARDIDAATAVSDFAERLAARTAEEGADATGDQSYTDDIPFDPIEAASAATPDVAAVEGPAGAAEPTQPGEPGGAVAAEDRTEVAQVPTAVRERVRQSIEYLREIEQRVTEAAELERRVGGAGRYQADVFSNRAQDIERARGRLAEFRRLAREKGIDPEAVIADLGGEPALTPSPEAQAWLERPDQGPIETAPRPTTETTPEGEQYVIPGAEQRGAKEVLERRMGARDVRGGQRGIEGLGLFDEGSRATTDDLFGPGGQVELNAGLPIGKVWDWWLGPFFQRYYEPFGTLEGRSEYLRERRISQGDIDQLGDLTREMQRMIDRHDPTTKEEIYQYLTTPNAPDTMVTDPNGRRDAASVKRMIDFMGREMVYWGLLTQEQYDKYKDRYLPRIYLKFLFNESSVQIGAGNRPKVPQSMMGRIKKRKDLSRFERDILLGEIKDPAYLVARAFGVAAHSISVLRFLDKVAQRPEWVYPQSLVSWRGRKYSARYLMTEAQRLRANAEYYPQHLQAQVHAAANAMEAAARTGIADPPDPGQYKQVPPTKRYGTLQGLWVKKEIYDDLVNSAAPEWRDEQLQWLAQQWRRTVSGWKATKTSLNIPAGHVRNHVSGSFQAQLFGQVPVHRLPDLYLSTMRDIARNGAGWQAAKRHGVRSTSFAQAELMKIHDEFKLKLGLKHYKHNPTRLVIEAASRLVNAAGDAYSGNEQFWKTLVMKYHMGRGMPEAEAAELAHTAIFDYSLVPNWLRWWRENILIGSPFATFLYKSIPLSIEAAFKRPWAYWPYVGMIWGMAALFSGYQGLDDEEVEAIRALLPKWLDHSQVVILPFKDQHGRFQAVDFSYWFPFGSLVKAAEDVGDSEVFKALGELGFASHPGMSIATGLTANQDGLGRPIWDSGDPAERQAMDIAAFLFGQALPPTAPQVKQLVDAIRGVPDRWGNPQRTTAQALARFAGVTIQPIDVEVAYMRGAWSRISAIRDAEQRAKEIARDQSLSDERKRQMLERQLAHIRKKSQELREWKAQVAPARSLAK